MDRKEKRRGIEKKMKVLRERRGRFEWDAGKKKAERIDGLLFRLPAPEMPMTNDQSLSLYWFAC